MYDFLATCAVKGITLKPERFQFARREVDFVGFQLGWEEYKPRDERLAAIRNFHMPSKPSITVMVWLRKSARPILHHRSYHERVPGAAEETKREARILGPPATGELPPDPGHYVS